MPSAPLLPVHHGVSVEGHEKHLAASSGSHRCKKYLFGSKEMLINVFYCYKKRSVNCLSERGKQELPPTPHGFLCLNLPPLLIFSTGQQKFYADPLPGSQFSVDLRGWG